MNVIFSSFRAYVIIVIRLLLKPISSDIGLFGNSLKLGSEAHIIGYSCKFFSRGCN